MSDASSCADPTMSLGSSEALSRETQQPPVIAVRKRTRKKEEGGGRRKKKEKKKKRSWSMKTGKQRKPWEKSTKNYHLIQTKYPPQKKIKKKTKKRKQSFYQQGPDRNPSNFQLH